MNETLSYEELQKTIADLRQKNMKLERVLKELRSDHDIQARIVDVFRSTPQMMAISNLSDGKYIEVNETFLQMLGYTREEIIGKSSEDIELFANLVQSNKFLKQLARLKKVKDFEVSIKTKNGKVLEYKFSAEPIMFGDERYLLTSYFPVAMEDNQLKDEMNEAFERLRDIFESLTNFVMIALPDDSGKIIVEYINPNSREFKSIGKDAIVGKYLAGSNMINKKVLLELIGKIHLTGQPHKLPILDNNKVDEGYYFGLKLNTEEIIVIWEPGTIKSSREKEMLVSSGVFERFANMIPNVVYEINLKGRVTFANNSGLKLFGYNKEDIEKGISIKDIFEQKDRKQVTSNLNTITKPGDSISTEYTVYNSKKETIPVHAHTTGIFDLTDKLLGYRGVITDLSDKIRIQEEILKEKIHLETLIESAPESIVQISTTGIIERINKEFTDEFGYTEKDCIGSNIDDILIPDDLIDEGSSYIKKGKNESIEVETLRKKKSGELISVSLLIKPVTFNDETTSLFAIYRNITDRQRNSKLKDIILNISNAALTKTEFTDMFSTFQVEIGKLWNTTNFYIVLYDEEKQLLSLPFYADEKDRFDNIPTKGTLTGWLIKSGKPHLLELPEIEILENNGEIDLIGTPCKVWLGVPLIIDGNIIGAMVLQDYNNQKAFNIDDLRLLNLIGNQIAIVIQRKEMMENLIIERAKAEEAARLKQQFMSTMSHEIRTPLNEVIGLTNLLLQGNPRSDQMEYIKTLRFSGNHLLTLVNDVLDFNKMESGMIVFEKTQFNFKEFMKELRRTYSFRTEEKGIDFKLEYNEDLPDEIIGDPIRLNQILSNLVSNAVKFTKDGYVKLEVSEISRESKIVELEFAVEDTGIGIPDDKLDDIFESYTQASEDTTRIFGGTGLGLSIVKRLIELQGSSIMVESKLGSGSRFVFTLSFAIAKTISKTSSTSDQTDEVSYNGLKDKRVLIAEDNKINYFVASKFLLKWGVKVTHALNGKIALDLINENEYDLVLMDLHMPEMDGLEATKLIRESDNPEIKNMPIIALTAAIMSEHEDKIEDLDINDYILKPFKPKELYDKIFEHAR